MWGVHYYMINWNVLIPLMQAEWVTFRRIMYLVDSISPGTVVHFLHTQHAVLWHAPCIRTWCYAPFVYNNLYRVRSCVCRGSCVRCAWQAVVIQTPSRSTLTQFMPMTVRPVSRRRQTPAPRSVFPAVTVSPSHCVRVRLSLGFTSRSTFLCSLSVSCLSVQFDDSSYLSFCFCICL